jgi:hypothetical protein
MWGEGMPRIHQNQNYIKVSRIAMYDRRLQGNEKETKGDLVRTKIHPTTRGCGREKVLGIKIYFTVCNVGYGSVTQRCRSENLAISAISKNEPYSLNNFMGKYQDFVGISLSFNNI